MLPLFKLIQNLVYTQHCSEEATFKREMIYTLQNYVKARSNSTPTKTQKNYSISFLTIKHQSIEIED